MNIDDLTLGEAKRLAAALAPLLGAPAAPVPAPAAPVPAPVDPAPSSYPVGRRVLVRANRAGVWAGLLIEAAGDRLTLSGRRLWSWSGALECSCLAVEGPLDGRLGPTTRVILGLSAEVIEVHLMADAAWAAVERIAPWSR